MSLIFHTGQLAAGPQTRSPLPHRNILTHKIPYLIFYFCYFYGFSYDCLANTMASCKSCGQYFFKPGEVTILQTVFYGNLQSSRLYKYLLIAHFICIRLSVHMHTYIHLPVWGSVLNICTVLRLQGQRLLGQCFSLLNVLVRLSKCRFSLSICMSMSPVRGPHYEQKRVRGLCSFYIRNV